MIQRVLWIFTSLVTFKGTVAVVMNNLISDNFVYNYCYTVDNHVQCRSLCNNRMMANTLICCGGQQSPIDVSSAAPCSFPHKLTFNSNYDINREFKVNHTGTTAEFSLVHPEHTAKLPMISGGPLTQNYSYGFEQFHFHWGRNSSVGSEHTIRGTRFPLEMHMVHKNYKYATVEEAAKHTDGFAVLSVLFQLSEADNEKFRHVTKALHGIPCENNTAVVKPIFSLRSLLPEQHDSYVTYFGSLTTGKHDEAVTWIIFENFGQISEEQLQAFRTLRSGSKKCINNKCKCNPPLVDNFRKLQPLNCRIIQANE